MSSEPDALRSARLGVGCAKLGEATNGVSWHDAIRILRDAADGGVTYFDTADSYVSGTSERLIGQALNRRRHEVTIATKAGYQFRERSVVESRLRFLAGPVVRRLGRSAVESATSEEGRFVAKDFSPTALRAALDASLRRLRTDYVDLFQLHAPTGIDLDVNAISELVADLTAAGKIRRFGIGVEHVAEAESWLDVAELESIQLPFGVLDRSAEPLIARARHRGVSVVARGVLAGGSLLKPDEGRDARGTTVAPSLVDELRRFAQRRGMTLMQLAVAFAAGHPGVDVVLVGVRVEEHLRGLLGASEFRAPGVELLDEIDAIIATHDCPNQPDNG